MRVGLVCPYGLDVPGGVGNHVRDLAVHLLRAGHDVSVLAPVDSPDTVLPDFVVPAGRTVAVPYNGSVARLAFGPRAAARTRRWLRDGAFDVLHVHEPASPSLGLLACLARTGPIVATFHTANPRSRALTASAGILRTALDKVTARIAVSEQARQTVVEHLGSDAVVIPNGVYTAPLRAARVAHARRAAPAAAAAAGVAAAVAGAAGGRPARGAERPVVAFLGRLDEPRKGLSVLLDAVPAIAAARPDVRVLVAGRGDVDQWARSPAGSHPAVEFLGEVDDAERARLLGGAEVYVAPHTGQESFGIVLVEAMAAGAAVVASDLPAFRDVLDGGRGGVLVPPGDRAALGHAVGALLADDVMRASLSRRGAAGSARYDWSVVGERIQAVYDLVSVRPGVPAPVRG